MHCGVARRVNGCDQCAHVCGDPPAFDHGLEFGSGVDGEQQNNDQDDEKFNERHAAIHDG